MKTIEKYLQINEKKIVLIVIDGLGGLPYNEKTELESAETPNLNRLAKISSLGLTIPVDYGITPGSGPAHLALFGYDPEQYEIGRGILEALGIGLEITKDDLCIRANFATIKNGIIIDRRAGRIATEENQRLCALLSSKIKSVSDIEVIIKPGKEHRFVIVLRGKGLNAQVSESDPQKDNLPPQKIQPLTSEAQKTADVLNIFIKQASEILENEWPANYFLLRGYAQHPDLPLISKRYRLKPAAIATYPMYKGIAKLLGMEVLDTQENWEDEIITLQKRYHDFDFFYVHFKETDMKGEDGDFLGKVKLIEKFDALLPEILKLNFDVLCITADHSTPAVLKSHSWHPNPFLLYSPYVLGDGYEKFSERNCAKGSLGIFPQTKVMQLLLAHSLKLKKFGA
ncbi:MAG: 2,3-bisphosphoglycerate-independent phosphoglycerate mutase [candidate division WOR-3 bacterium]|nr:2,3-bisphosphoglycerate-independent phosphoglycerate mutase [candidate division WOR-3 bacterium]